MGCQVLDATGMVSVRHAGSSGEGALPGAGQGSWRGEENRRRPSHGLCLQVPSHLLSETVVKVLQVIRGDACFVFLLLCQLTLPLLLKEKPREVSSDLN